MKLTLSTDEGEVLEIFEKIEEYFNTQIARNCLWSEIREEIDRAIERRQF